MAYEVTTTGFEGPFDLLLHLILREQVDLYEVSLARIVDAYLVELDKMETLDLEITTEFLLIAATLVELKCKRLLPEDADVDLDDEFALWEERDLLIARLLDCKTFKDAAQVLGELADAFALPDDARACLVGRFSSDSTARDLVNSADEPTVAERTALAEAVDACMTRDQFAAAIAARITAQLPPPDSAGIATQIDCLTTALLGLSQSDHEGLVVGLLVLSAPPTGELALARSQAVNDLNTTCGITPSG